MRLMLQRAVDDTIAKEGFAVDIHVGGSVGKGSAVAGSDIDIIIHLTPK